MSVLVTGALAAAATAASVATAVVGQASKREAAKRAAAEALAAELLARGMTLQWINWALGSVTTAFSAAGLVALWRERRIAKKLELGAQEVLYSWPLALKRGGGKPTVGGVLPAQVRYNRICIAVHCTVCNVLCVHYLLQPWLRFCLRTHLF